MKRVKFNLAELLYRAVVRSAQTANNHDGALREQTALLNTKGSGMLGKKSNLIFWGVAFSPIAGAGDREAFVNDLTEASSWVHMKESPKRVIAAEHTCRQRHPRRATCPCGRRSQASRAVGQPQLDRPRRPPTRPTRPLRRRQ